jgi:hypothetical protein
VVEEDRVSDVIEAKSGDNEWRRAQVEVKNAKPGVEVLFWPHAGWPREGCTARLALKWATFPTYSKQQSVVIPDVCMLLRLDEMKALQAKVNSIVEEMEALKAETSHLEAWEAEHGDD